MAFLIKLLLWSLAGVALMLVPLLISYLPDYGGFSFLDHPLNTEKTLWWYIDLATYALGLSLYFFPLAMLAIAWRFSRHQDWRISQIVFLTACMAWGYLLAQAALAGLFTLHIPASKHLPPSIDAGGAIGNSIAAYGLQLGFSIDVVTLLLLSIFIFSFSIMLWIPWISLLEKTGKLFWLPFESKAFNASLLQKTTSTVQAEEEKPLDKTSKDAQHRTEAEKSASPESS
jgi:DNA segregation ATPase FtsK/SpoIIIE-like protein